jgi:hypothetical protein
MATLQQKIEAEVRFRRLAEEHGLPSPDGIEYGHTCIRVFWHDTGTVLVIDIDEPPATGIADEPPEEGDGP